MSVRGTLGGVFASVAVLIIGWQVGAAALGHPVVPSASGTTGTTGTPGTGTTGTSGATGTTGSSDDGGDGGDDGATRTTSAPSGPSSSSGSSGSPTSSLKNGSYTGTAMQTPYGVIQVAVTVSGGRITDVTTPQLQAFDDRSRRINNQAVPILKQEVLQAQSARVGMVSGATFTSDGYLSSLQSALDRAV